MLVEWGGWANSMEFSALLTAEIRALKDHSGRRLLADCRKQRVLNPADQDRADQEWLPKALAAGLRKFAIVPPVSTLAAMNLRERLNRVPDKLLEVRFFETVDQAKAWLAEKLLD